MRRLLLLPRQGEPDDYREDFEAIAAMIRQSAPSIEVVVHRADESTIPPTTRSSATASWCRPSSTPGAILATIGS
jgi:hypothetical protein